MNFPGADQLLEADEGGDASRGLAEGGAGAPLAAGQAAAAAWHVHHHQQQMMALDAVRAAAAAAARLCLETRGRARRNARHHSHPSRPLHDLFPD